VGERFSQPRAHAAALASPRSIHSGNLSGRQPAKWVLSKWLFHDPGILIPDRTTALVTTLRRQYESSAS